MACFQEEKTQDSESKERAREGGSHCPKLGVAGGGGAICPASSSPRATADSCRENEGLGEQRKLSPSSKKK